MKGYIVLGHGSGSEEYRLEQERVVELLAERLTDGIVKSAHLRLCEPSLSKVVEALAGEGVTEVAIMPMFLFSGNHVKKDIPREIDALKSQFPGLQIHVAGHIGPDPQLVDIVEERLRQLPWERHSAVR